MLNYVSKRTSRYWRWLQSLSYAVNTCYRRHRVRFRWDHRDCLLKVLPSDSTQVAVEPPRLAPTRPSHRKEVRSLSTSHSWHQTQPSPRARRMSATVHTPSSRGSWSSLFNTGSVRQFMAGAHGSPDAGSPGVTDVGLPERLPVPGAVKPREPPARTLSQSPLKRGVAKSWSESTGHVRRNPSVTGTRRPMLSEFPTTEKVEKPLNNKKLVAVIALRDSPRWEKRIYYNLRAVLTGKICKRSAELPHGMARADGDACHRICGTPAPLAAPETES